MRSLVSGFHIFQCAYNIFYPGKPEFFDARIELLKALIGKYPHYSVKDQQLNFQSELPGTQIVITPSSTSFTYSNQSLKEFSASEEYSSVWETIYKNLKIEQIARFDAKSAYINPVGLEEANKMTRNMLNKKALSLLDINVKQAQIGMHFSNDIFDYSLTINPAVLQNINITNQSGLFVSGPQQNVNIWQGLVSAYQVCTKSLASSEFNSCVTKIETFIDKLNHKIEIGGIS